METLIILLSIAVILLSLVILAVLIAAALVLVKLNRIFKQVEHVTNNFSRASEWMVPTKLFTTVVHLFRK